MTVFSVCELFLNGGILLFSYFQLPVQNDMFIHDLPCSTACLINREKKTFAPFTKDITLPQNIACDCDVSTG